MSPWDLGGTLRASFLAILSLLALSPTAAAGQVGGTPELDVQADTVELSLETALRRAIDESAEARLARSEIAIAETQVRAARAAALPQLDGQASYTHTFRSPFGGGGGGMQIPDSLRFDPDPSLPLEERVAYLEDRVPSAALGGLGSLFGDLPFGQKHTYVVGLTLSQPIYSGGKLGAGMEIARQYREAIGLGYSEAISEIDVTIRRAYWQALLARELADIAAQALEQAETFLAQEQLRFDAGLASELDLLRAEVEVENLRPRLTEARNAEELATLELKRLISVPADATLRLTTELNPPSGLPVHADRLGDVAGRPALVAQERTVDIREQEVRIARGGFLPSLDFRMSYGGQMLPQEAFGLSRDDWRTDWSATLALSVPIFSGFRRKAELDRSRITLGQERVRLDQLRRSLEMEYTRASGARERALEETQAGARTVEQAERVHDLTVLRYEQGLATQLEVTNARLALLQARTNLARASADYRIADAEAARAAGRTPEGTR